LLLAGYEGLKEREKKIPRAAMPRLREAVERLVQLYEEWNKPAEVEAWRAKLQ